MKNALLAFYHTPIATKQDRNICYIWQVLLVSVRHDIALMAHNKSVDATSIDHTSLTKCEISQKEDLNSCTAYKSLHKSIFFPPKVTLYVTTNRMSITVS